MIKFVYFVLHSLVKCTSEVVREGASRYYCILPLIKIIFYITAYIIKRCDVLYIPPSWLACNIEYLPNIEYIYVI